MKKVTLIFIVFSFLLFAGCSFDAPVSMAPASPVSVITNIRIKTG